MAVDWNAEPPLDAERPVEVEIFNIIEALEWGDSWVEAYRELWRERERREIRLREELFWEWHRAEMYRFEVALLRAQIALGEEVTA